jgi:hypothetical protein
MSYSLEPLTAAAQEDALRAMQQVMSEYPDLTYAGFGHEGIEDLTAPVALVEFIACRTWMARCVRTQHVNMRASSSYGLKHAVERAYDCYIANGTLIAAAIAEGFLVKRDGINAQFNITRKQPHLLAELEAYNQRRWDASAPRGQWMESRLPVDTN